MIIISSPDPSHDDGDYHDNVGHGGDDDTSSEAALCWRKRIIIGSPDLSHQHQTFHSPVGGDDLPRIDKTV